MSNEQNQPDRFEAIWQDDLLDRRQEAEFLIKFLVNRCKLHARDELGTSYVFNIDAEWGQGKSFFMRHLRDHLAEEKYPAVYIDAWQDDFSNEPFTAVMSAIDEFVKPHLAKPGDKAGRMRSTYEATKRNFGRLSVALATGAAKKLAGKAFGAGVEEALAIYEGDPPVEADAKAKESGENEKGLVKEIAEDATATVTKEVEALLDSVAEKQIERFKEAKQSLGSFRENLNQFLLQFADANAGEMRLPFFVLVDELDRCRPTYAVEMLERIKHLFDVPNVVFVLSTNTDQLSHAIKAVYGEGFDGRGYLDRFFQRTYMLPTPKLANIIEYLWRTTKVDEVVIDWPTGPDGVKRFIHDVVQRFLLTIRQLERLMEVFSALTVMWTQKVKIDPIVLLPMIAMHVRGESLADIQSSSRSLQKRLSEFSDWTIDMQPAPWLREQQAPMSVKQYVNDRIANSSKSFAQLLEEQQELSSNSLDLASMAPQEMRVAYSMRSRMIQTEVKSHCGNGGNVEERSPVFSYVNLIQRAGRLVAD